RMARRQRRRRRLRRRGHSRTVWRTRPSVLSGAGVVTGGALAFASPALADSEFLYVGTLADDGATATDCTDNSNTDCTLRQAIEEANANSHQYDYVVFKSGLSGTVHLGTGLGQIPITDEVYVGSSPTAGISALSGDDQSRIFDIDVTHGYSYVTIARLKLIDGDTSGNGGAIRNEDSYLYLVESTISGSHADGNGGAIYNADTDEISYGARNRVGYSSIYGNSAEGDGGAIAGKTTFGSIY